MLRLKRGPPSGGVRTLHLLEKYPSHSHPLPPTLLPLCCLQTASDFLQPFVPCFLPASLRCDRLLLLWLCGSGYLAKEATRRSCVCRQKGGRCFLTVLRLTWLVRGKHKRLAPLPLAGASTTDRRVNNSCFSPALSSSSAAVFRFQEIKGVEYETSTGSVFVSSPTW